MEPTASTGLMVLKQVQIQHARQLVATQSASEVPGSAERLLKDVAAAAREDGVGRLVDHRA